MKYYKQFINMIFTTKFNRSGSNQDLFGLSTGGAGF